jgi:hypothetical protein
MSTAQQAGWYPDPWGQAARRWWDGQQWTSNVEGPAATGTTTQAPQAQPSPWQAQGAQGAQAHGPWAAAPGGQPAGMAGYGAAPTAQAPANPLVKVLALGGAALAAIGSFLPWATVSGFVDISKNGMDGDGVITLVGALIFGGLAAWSLLGSWSKGRMIGALVVAVLVTLIAVIDIADVASRFSDIDTEALGLDVSIGIGLWIVLLGGLVGVAGCVMALVTAKPANRSA